MEGEIWRPIPGYGGEYEASTLGRVRSYRVQRSKCGSLTNTPKILRPGAHPKGYLSVVLGSKRLKTQRCRKVHHLVLETFVGPKPVGKETAHLDRNKANNALENLSWVPAKTNTSHKWLHGTMPTKLTESQVREIRTMYADRFHPDDIAKKFKISKANVWMIASKRTWRHVV